MFYLAGILGLALLMIVHEYGHFFAARAFNMRVERFSIGFGPAIWRHQPRGSDTVFQVALIPFLAYVQIAGMNPFEESDPNDKGSYANASLIGRIIAIVAGPLANYLFASVLFFAAALLGGKLSEEPIVTVLPDGAAAQAGLQSGDVIVSIDGHAIKTWKDIPGQITPHPEKSLTVQVDRAGKPLDLQVIPRPRDGKGFIGVTGKEIPMPISEAATHAVVQPAVIVAITTVSIARMITGKEKGQLSGPIGIMRESKKAAELGLAFYLMLLGFLSTSVGFFNMLPLPALDGGRLVFLAYEAITRQKPNQKFEAQVHMVGMLMLLTTLVIVSFQEWRSDKTPSELAQESRKEELKAQSDKLNGHKHPSDKLNGDKQPSDKPASDKQPSDKPAE